MSVLEIACPSLKFLKVSGLGSVASFVKEVKEAMENSENKGEESMLLFPAKFPSQVHRVTLQVGPAPKVVDGGKGGNAAVDVFNGGNCPLSCRFCGAHSCHWVGWIM